ncbi:hypothetical protein BSPWISOXPB_3511 [uncultured Gammaproteobacteria bacterium]|nr:hypothetical protein BSPWISOXPB_3511 [uncultured Gammaproteobacteria bacterium]
MLMSLAVPLMLLSAWMLTPAALMLLLALRVMLLPLSVELTAVFLILPSKSSLEVRVVQFQLNLQGEAGCFSIRLIQAAIIAALMLMSLALFRLSCCCASILDPVMLISSLVVFIVRLLVVKFEAICLQWLWC